MLLLGAVDFFSCWSPGRDLPYIRNVPPSFRKAFSLRPWRCGCISFLLSCSCSMCNFFRFTPSNANIYAYSLLCPFRPLLCPLLCCTPFHFFVSLYYQTTFNHTLNYLTMTISLFFTSGLYYVYSNACGDSEHITVRTFSHFDKVIDYSIHLLLQSKNEYVKDSPF